MAFEFHPPDAHLGASGKAHKTCWGERAALFRPLPRAAGPRAVTEVPHRCAPAGPQRTWENEGTLSRPHFPFHSPTPSSRAPTLLTGKKQSCSRPGGISSRGAGPAAPLAACPARPARGSAPGCGFSAPQQVARDAPGEPGNRSLRREGRPGLPRAELRASGAIQACVPSRPPRPAPRGSAPAGARAWALRVPAPLREAGLYPVEFWSWIPPPPPSSDHPFAGKWFYSGAGRWGWGCRPG